MASTPNPNRNPDEPILLDHEYDGIREYDQRLPNWWLATLFGAIIFAAGYWFYYFQSKVAKDDRVLVTAELAALEERKKNDVGLYDDTKLWEMSKDQAIVDAGAATFKGICSTCHTPPGGALGTGVKSIGFNLVDNTWVHGNTPKAIFTNVYNGIPQTNMMSQKQLGPQKVAEVVAFLMSKQKPDNMKVIARADEPSQK